MKLSKFLILASLLPLMNACSVVAVRNYDPYYKNTQRLEAVKNTFKEVHVKSGTASAAQAINQDSLTCRLTTFNMPANKTVAQYIEDALKSELDAGKKISPNGENIVVTVNKLESDTSGMSAGSWTLDFTYKTDKSDMNVKTVTEFTSAFAADTACRNTAQALETALRENFSKYFEKL